MAAGPLAVAIVGVALLAACRDDAKSTSGAGIVLSSTSLVTAESGPNGTFSVSLATAPASQVDVDVWSTDITEGRVIQPGASVPSSIVKLHFVPADWSVPQAVQVAPQDDQDRDGSQSYTISAGVSWTADPQYTNVPGRTISVINTDDELPGFTVSKTTASTSEAPTNDSFTVRLDVAPAASITIPVEVADVSEGLLKGGDSPSIAQPAITLTFTTANWNVPQTVTVVGQGDSIADGNQTYSTTVGPPAGTAEFAAVAAQTVSVTNSDDDIAGLTVALAEVPLRTSENGTTATFTVRLNTEPIGDVTVAVTSGDAAEGLLSSGAQNGLAALALSFTRTSWSTPQLVTVTGQDDAAVPVQGDNVRYAVAVGPATGDVAYAAVAPQAVQVLNVDNDVAAVIVPGSGSGAEPLQTRESGTGTTATFSVLLNKAPTGPVVVRVTSNDVSEGLLRGGDSPTVAAQAIDLTFTPDDFLTPQAVTVVGQADSAADGNQTYTIGIGTPTGDPSYASVAPQTIQVANADTDVAGYTVSATTVAHAEGLSPATFTVRLNVKPSADVIVPVSSGNAAEGLVAGGDSGGAFVSSLNLTFTAVNWSTPQTVQVNGPVDWVADGAQSYVITVGPTSSSSAPFGGLAAKLVSATCNDVDVAGFTVVPAAGLVTSEAGAAVTFTVKLTSKPLYEVTLRATVDDATEALLSAGGSPASAVELRFTGSSWNATQTVTVTGQQDAVLDGNRPFVITAGPTVSADPKYAALAAKTVSGTNTDDDVGASEGTGTPQPLTLGVSRPSQVGPSSSSYYVTVATLPAGATFGVSLSNPSATVSVTADDDGTYASGTLCTVTISAAGSGVCVGTVPASGKVYVRVSTTSTSGAGYQLLVTGGLTFTSTDVPKEILEGPGPVGEFQWAKSTLPVTGLATAISKVTVKLSIAHPYDSDLWLVLRAPSGTLVTLSRLSGGSGHDYTDTVLDDAAATSISAAVAPFTGSFRPYEPLSALAGEDANGIWELRVADLYVGNAGSITGWSIELL